MSEPARRRPRKAKNQSQSRAASSVAPSPKPNKPGAKAQKADPAAIGRSIGSTFLGTEVVISSRFPWGVWKGLLHSCNHRGIRMKGTVKVEVNPQGFIYETPLNVGEGRELAFFGEEHVQEIGPASSWEPEFLGGGTKIRLPREPD